MDTQREYDQATIDYIEEKRRAREAKRADFEKRLTEASNTGPSDYKKLRDLVELSGLPLDTVRRNREQIEKEFAPLKLNLNNAPQLQRLLDGKDPYMFYVGKDAPYYAALEEQGRSLPAITLDFSALWYKGKELRH